MIAPAVDPHVGAVVVGLMSGTSLDGISAAAVRLVDTADGRIDAALLAFTHRAYADDERARLEAAMRTGSARDYCRLHADLGDWLGEAAMMALARAGLTSAQVAAIASHGQTLWHEPGHSTWQIGDAARIAERTGCAVIADFRARDVAVGGEGAPLVPMADARLFAHPTQWRALQNIGGIGNVSIVPPSGVPATGIPATGIPATGEPSHAATATEPMVRAFDTGPGVVLIDAVTRVVRPQLPYDRDGLLALAGTPVQAVVDDRLRAPFFHRAPPKSTGREWFTREYIDAFVQDCRAHGARDEDIVATATSFTARSIADQFARFVREPVQELIVSGGGAQNPALMQALAQALAEALGGASGVSVVRFDERFFDGEAKEAVAFALLGYLHLTGRSGNVVHATGARAARVLGHYTPAA